MGLVVGELAAEAWQVARIDNTRKIKIE